MVHPDEAPAPIDLLDLSVEQGVGDLPGTVASAADPLAEVGGEGILVQSQAIAGDDRHPVRGQDRSQRMDDPMSRVLGARPQMQHGDDFAQRIPGDPEPQDLLPGTQPRADLIELEMGQGQIVKQRLMQSFGLLTRPHEPPGDRRLSVLEHAHRCPDVEPFGQRAEHDADLRRRGLQALEGAAPTDAELGAAGLPAQVRNTLALAMSAIRDEGMQALIGDTVIHACWSGAGVALRRSPFGGAAAALDFRPRADRRHAGHAWLVLQGHTPAAGAIVRCAGVPAPSSTNARWDA